MSICSEPLRFAHVNVTAIELEPKPGAHVGDCMVDAALCSLANQANVKFRHNSVEYRVHFNDLVHQVIKHDPGPI